MKKEKKVVPVTETEEEIGKKCAEEVNAVLAKYGYVITVENVVKIKKA